MTYDCMTPEEYALWAEQVARARAKEPCHDCPLWFATLAQEQGKCCRVPGPHRPIADTSDKLRRQWREASRRRRARASQ